MSDAEKIVIVGASLAGARAAEGAREAGFEGEIVLIGDEPERPYERPPLSKDYLRGEKDDLAWVHEESFYAEHDIDLRTSTFVSGIDPAGSPETMSLSTFESRRSMPCSFAAWARRSA